MSLLAFVADTPPAKAEHKEWVLVFSDEFNQPDGSQPDPSKWSRHWRGGSTWSRWISDSKKTVFIKNGALVCRAIPNKYEPGDTAAMLTGAINTKDKFSFQYGKVEVRMRTNMTLGNFPAAWMVPQPGGSDTRYGEIDIVEMFGNQGKSAHTAHTHRSFTLKKEGIKREFREDVSVKKWHVYGLEWDKDKLEWFVDGMRVGIYHRDNRQQMVDEGQWTFDRQFFLILNQSVGDGKHPLLIPNTKKTYETQFDWIRVYQRKTSSL
jgi:beta-glucanase (GH16 family)